MRSPFGSPLALAAALFGSGLTLVSATPASAQYLYPPRVVVPVPAPMRQYGPIPPHEVAQLMMRRGFLEIDPPQMRGDIYVVTGVNARGDRVRLVIDAYDGEVLRRRRVEETTAWANPAPAFPRPPRAVPYGGREYEVLESEDDDVVPRSRATTSPRGDYGPRSDYGPRDDDRSRGEYGLRGDDDPASMREERTAPSPRRTSRVEQPKKAPAPPVRAAVTPSAPIPPVETARPESVKSPPVNAAQAEIKLAAPPAAPPVVIPGAPETTGSPRAVRVIDGVTAVPGDAPKPTE